MHDTHDRPETEETTPGDHSSTQATPPRPPPVSDEEARLYYAGLPSRPLLVARTGTTPFELPTGPEAYPKLKELRIAGNHKIKEIWEDNLGLKVIAILDEKKVLWTSIDVVRFGYEEEPSGNVVIWIGVKPGSLSREHGMDVALQCKGLLLDHNLDDVDVEIRESLVIRY